MFNTIRLPVVSPTSGAAQDGLLVGRINSSDLVASYLMSRIVTIKKVVREDFTSTGSTLLDMTTAATDATAGDFAPFGAAAQMSQGDAVYFYVEDGNACHKMHFQIATPGVGTWTLGLQEWDTVAEAWSDVSGLTDNSNNMRNAAGVYTLSWEHIKSGSMKLHHTDTAKHVWHRLYVKTFTSATTAPVLSRLWAESPTDTYTDTTAATNSSTFSVLPAEILPTLDAANILIHPGVPVGLDVNVVRAESANFTVTREYLASDGTWKAIPDLADPSNGYRNTGSHRIRWSRPSDWVEKTVTILGAAKTGWFERTRISAVSVAGPVAPSQVSADSRALGSANAKGLVLGAVSYRYATINAGANNATAGTVLSMVNAENGATVTFSIPQGVDDGSDEADGKHDLSGTATFTDGQSLLLMCLSGGPLLDVELRLHK